MANATSPTSPADPARFLFGLVGFIGFAALLDSYDQQHGTDYLYAYSGLVILGIVTFQRDNFTAGIVDLQNAFSGK